MPKDRDLVQSTLKLAVTGSILALKAIVDPTNFVTIMKGTYLIIPTMVGALGTIKENFGVVFTTSVNSKVLLMSLSRQVSVAPLVETMVKAMTMQARTAPRAIILGMVVGTVVGTAVDTVATTTLVGTIAAATVADTAATTIPVVDTAAMTIPVAGMEATTIPVADLEATTTLVGTTPVTIQTIIETGIAETDGTRVQTTSRAIMVHMDTIKDQITATTIDIIKVILGTITTTLVQTTTEEAAHTVLEVIPTLISIKPFVQHLGNQVVMRIV